MCGCAAVLWLRRRDVRLRRRDVRRGYASP